MCRRRKSLKGSPRKWAGLSNFTLLSRMWLVVSREGGGLGASPNRDTLLFHCKRWEQLMLGCVVHLRVLLVLGGTPGCSRAFQKAGGLARASKGQEESSGMVWHAGEGAGTPADGGHLGGCEPALGPLERALGSGHRRRYTAGD